MLPGAPAPQTASRSCCSERGGGGEGDRKRQKINKKAECSGKQPEDGHGRGVEQKREKNPNQPLLGKMPAGSSRSGENRPENHVWRGLGGLESHKNTENPRGEAASFSRGKKKDTWNRNVAK